MVKIYLCFLFIASVMTDQSKTSTNPTTSKPLIRNLWEKFHQNDYKFTFERVELLRINKSIADCHIRTFKFNRTTPVVNGSFVFAIDLGYEMEVIIQWYRFASNEYREFPIRYQASYCDALLLPAMGVNKLSKFGNLKCPCLKGTKYYFYNWSPEEANFPPFVPSGSYMLEAQFIYHSSEVFVTNAYGIIYRPVPMG